MVVVDGAASVVEVRRGAPRVARCPASADPLPLCRPQCRPCPDALTTTALPPLTSPVLPVWA